MIEFGSEARETRINPRSKSEMLGQVSITNQDLRRNRKLLRIRRSLADSSEQRVLGHSKPKCAKSGSNPLRPTIRPLVTEPHLSKLPHSGQLLNQPACAIPKSCRHNARMLFLCPGFRRSLHTQRSLIPEACARDQDLPT